MSERARDHNYLFLFVKEKWNGRFKNHFTFAEENMVIKQKNLMKIIMRDKNPLKSVTGFCTKNDRDSVENHLQYDFFLKVTKGYLIAL